MADLRFHGQQPADSALFDQLPSDDNYVVVSGEWLDAQGRWYPVSELQNLRAMHPRHGDLTICSGMATAVVTLAIARLWDRLNTAGWIGALSLLAASLVLLSYGLSVRRRRGVLVAEVGGVTKLVVSDVDERKLNRIIRTVRRAGTAQ
jgi:Family of unknown function (DUF6232)